MNAMDSVSDSVSDSISNSVSVLYQEVPLPVQKRADIRRDLKKIFYKPVITKADYEHILTIPIDRICKFTSINASYISKTTYGYKTLIYLSKYLPVKNQFITRLFDTNLYTIVFDNELITYEDMSSLSKLGLIEVYNHDFYRIVLKKMSEDECIKNNPITRKIGYASLIHKKRSGHDFDPKCYNMIPNMMNHKDYTYQLCLYKSELKSFLEKYPDAIEQIDILVIVHNQLSNDQQSLNRLDLYLDLKNQKDLENHNDKIIKFIKLYDSITISKYLLKWYPKMPPLYNQNYLLMSLPLNIRLLYTLKSFKTLNDLLFQFQDEDNASNLSTILNYHNSRNQLIITGNDMTFRYIHMHPPLDTQIIEYVSNINTGIALLYSNVTHTYNILNNIPYNPFSKLF